MTNTVIPDEILENLVCSSCKKYLSAKPIKIYPNRHIRCGRCVEEEDNGVESLYGLFAEEVLFPCVNRHEGCDQLLGYSEVRTHEQVCCAGSYPCVICNDYNGSAYELFMHFKIWHENNIMYLDELPININSESMEQYYLYRKRNLLFMISVKCDKMSEELLLNMTFIGPEHKGYYLKYQFMLYNLKKDLKYTATKKILGCSPVGTITNSQVIKFSDLGNNETVFICKIQINASECEGLINSFKPSHAKYKQKPNELKKERTSQKLSTNNSCIITRPPKLDQSVYIASTSRLELNDELKSVDILESKVRPIIKRKLFVNVANTETLPKNESIKILVSDDQTSIIFLDGDERIEFEMICFGCKQNLPIISNQSNNGLYAIPMIMSYTVYGCMCPNNLVCEDCFSIWNFRTCKNGHQYINKIAESTLLAILHYDDWKAKGIFKELHFLENLLDSTVLKHCSCRHGPITFTFSYLDLLQKLLALNLSLLDIGLFSYHVRNCYMFYQNQHKIQFQFLWPFISHSIYFRYLLPQTYVAVVNNLIIIERFPNSVTTAFRLRFSMRNQEGTIVSILNLQSGYKIFKGDFIIWNTDITSETMITLRVI